MADNQMLLNEDNFSFYASTHYKNTYCLDISDFYTDLNHLKYIKKLLNKYSKKKILQERLILNHLIIFYNSFEFSAATAMCFFKLDEEHWPALKTFLLYLNYIHDNQYGTIPCDLYITKKLQQL